MVCKKISTQHTFGLCVAVYFSVFILHYIRTKTFSKFLFGDKWSMIYSLNSECRYCW